MAASAGDIFGSASAANSLAALTLAFSAGQASGPVIAGYLAERSGGFNSSYTGSAILALLAIGLVALLKMRSASE